MQTNAFNLLKPVGEVLLLGSLGFSFLQVTRGEKGLTQTFEAAFIAVLALQFSQVMLSGLDDLSERLTEELSAQTSDQSIQEFVLGSMERASKLPSESRAESFNIPEALSQAWRIGVWGSLSALIEGFFLIVFHALRAAKQVFWALTLTFFPVAAGVYPVAPKILLNLATYAFELALWLPCLEVISFASGQVARTEVSNFQGSGLYIIAIELVTILLILSVPMFVHRFLSGAFSGDWDAQNKMIAWSRALSLSVRSQLTKKGVSS